MLGYPNATANVTETYCGDVKLKNSEFYNEHYCGDNFNNILKSMKILFDLMVVNQWHSILCHYHSQMHFLSRGQGPVSAILYMHGAFCNPINPMYTYFHHLVSALT
jgi:hypothetical protein